MESSFSPRETVSELEKFIIGQKNAKRAVAVALRNRWRRKQLDKTLRDEIVPKNILIVCQTGCSKTEKKTRAVSNVSLGGCTITSKAKINVF